MFLRGIVTQYSSSPLGRLQSYAQSGGLLEDAAGKFLGSNLTGAEREANEFTHNERIEAQDWTAQREDTEIQRRMADMQAAGINPMMAAAGGTSSSSSGGQSVSPQSGSLSDLLQLATLGPQIKLINAQAENMRASAEEKTTKSSLNEAKVKLTESQIEEIKQKIEESKKRIEKIDSDIVRNAALNALSYAEAHLAEVNAEDLQQLRASRIALNEAKTQEAKADAALAYVNKLYQSKLIEAGMPQAVVDKVLAEKGLADAEKRATTAKAISTEIINGRLTGSFTATVDRILREQGIESHGVTDSIVGFLFNFADAVNITI